MQLGGKKLEKQSSSKDKFRALEAQLQNTQMALQMSQMMIKHLTDQFKTFQNDLGSTMGMLNDFQYRTLAMLELSNFSKDDVDAKAEQFKLKDFDAASDKEDAEKGYTLDNDGAVAEDSVIIITSATPDLKEDQGIFRSKFPMVECISPNLREALIGLKVGESADADIYSIKHKITVLSIRKAPQKQAAAVEKED